MSCVFSPRIPETAPGLLQGSPGSLDRAADRPAGPRGASRGSGRGSPAHHVARDPKPDRAPRSGGGPRQRPTASPGEPEPTHPRLAQPASGHLEVAGGVEPQVSGKIRSTEAQHFLIFSCVIETASIIKYHNSKCSREVSRDVLFMRSAPKIEYIGAERPPFHFFMGGARGRQPSSFTSLRIGVTLMCSLGLSPPSFSPAL